MKVIIKHQKPLNLKILDHKSKYGDDHKYQKLIIVWKEACEYFIQSRKKFILG